MKKKIAWLGVSWLVVAALVLASCGPTVPEVEEEEEEEEVVAETVTLSNGETFPGLEIEVAVTVSEACVTDSYEYHDRASDSMLSKEASPGTSFLIAFIKLDNWGGTDWRLTEPWCGRFYVTDSENNTYLNQEYLGENPLKATYILDGTAKDGWILFNIPEGASGLKIVYKSWDEPIRLLAEWEIE